MKGLNKVILCFSSLVMLFSISFTNNNTNDNVSSDLPSSEIIELPSIEDSSEEMS